MKKQIIISSSLNEVRIAITENGQLAELLVESPEKERLVGSVFYGRVRNIVQGMNAAFVDIGLDQDAFLHFSDVAESLEDNFITDEDDEDEDEKPKPQSQKQPRNDRNAQPPHAETENPTDENLLKEPSGEQQDNQRQNKRNDRNKRRNERRHNRGKHGQHDAQTDAQQENSPLESGQEIAPEEHSQEVFKNPFPDSFKSSETLDEVEDLSHVQHIGEENLEQEGFIDQLIQTSETIEEAPPQETPSEAAPKPKRKYTRRAPKKLKGGDAAPEGPFRTESFAMHDPNTEVFKENFPDDNSGNSSDGNSPEGDRNRRNHRNNRRGGRGRGGRGRGGRNQNNEQQQEFPAENAQPGFENISDESFKNEESANNPFKSDDFKKDAFKNEEIPVLKSDEQAPAENAQTGFRNNNQRNQKPPRGPRPNRNQQPQNQQQNQQRQQEPQQQNAQEQKSPEHREQHAPAPKKGDQQHKNNKKFEPRNDQKHDKRYPTFQTKRSGLVTIQLEKDQDIVVQVVREAYHAKGVRVSTAVSFPGRYTVFMPFEKAIGVSRKITSFKERKRLRALAKSILPEGSGCIIRTAADGKSEEELQRDMTYLRDQWLEIERKVKAATGPGPVYRDMSLASSAMRDLFTTDVERVVVDSKKLFNEITEYLQFTSPNLVSKVELYEGREHVFDATGVAKDIQQMFQRKVPLQSGGSIVIDHTEALVAIDVNSGRASGGSDQEANNVRLNFEAAREVARQIRLRDIGGMIIVDFIDMNDERNRLKIYHEMRKQLSFDRAKTVAYPITQLGLLQITRQRVHQNITEKMTEICPLCNGTGRVQSRSEVIHAIERWLKTFRAQSRDFKLTLAVHPAIATYLTEGALPKLTRLMLKYFLKVKIQPDDKLHIHDFRFYGKDGRDITKNF